MPLLHYLSFVSLISAIYSLENVPVTTSDQHAICDDLDLPDKHVQLFLNAFPDTCPFAQLATEQTPTAKLMRWGYERDSGTTRFSQPKCPGSHIGYIKDKSSQLNAFFTQADFGYIRQQIHELRVMCEANFIYDSSLECSKNLRYCNGRNLFLDLTDVANRKEPIRYHMDVLKEGQIGGYCTLHADRLNEEIGHLSALQSWAPEMRFFRSLDRRPFLDEDLCDVYVDKPTVIMKLDASVNMYHHFCDFFNLYASLHVNATHPRFYSRDINILIWETHQYRSAFGETFKAFTSNPLMDLTTFQGKRVCFRNLMFPLLPRMIFGLFYNTPIVSLLLTLTALSRHLLTYPLSLSLLLRSTAAIRVVSSRPFPNSSFTGCAFLCTCCPMTRCPGCGSRSCRGGPAFGTC